MGDRKFIEQPAKEMPDMKDVRLKLSNLHLHASGVFSNVYRGTLIMPNGTRKEVAIKKTWPNNRDRNFEMIFLTGISRSSHKNIVQMLYAFSNKWTNDKICESFIFEFMPDTLSTVIKRWGLDITDAKLYTFQLFTGLKYLAQENIVHRDIKPVNILLDHSAGLLKIGDFGSAKIVVPNQASTPYQVTRFYRPPELLLGSSHYGTMVDIWSAGCVVGEMLKGKVLFAGRDAQHQLRLIFFVLGIPTEGDIRAMRVATRTDALQKNRFQPRGLQAAMPGVSVENVNFVSKVLTYQPKQRYCGRELLRDAFFQLILAPGAKRSTGQPITDILTTEYIQEAQSCEEKQRFSRLGQLMTRKIDLAFQSTTMAKKKTVVSQNLSNKKPEEKSQDLTSHSIMEKLE